MSDAAYALTLLVITLIALELQHRCSYRRGHEDGLDAANREVRND